MRYNSIDPCTSCQKGNAYETKTHPAPRPRQRCGGGGRAPRGGAGRRHAAAAVWLLCRWVGYDLQLRIGNEPVYEIANDDYTQIIDVPEDGLWQAVPLRAGQTLYGCRLRFSTHGELYRAGMVMVDLCDADGTILREAAGNYANIFDDNFTGFAFGTAYTAAQAETLYLHIYNVVEWEGPLGLWASTGTDRGRR